MDGGYQAVFYRRKSADSVSSHYLVLHHLCEGEGDWGYDGGFGGAYWACTVVADHVYEGVWCGRRVRGVYLHRFAC